MINLFSFFIQLVFFPQVFPSCIYQQSRFANKRRLKRLLNHKPKLWRNNELPCVWPKGLLTFRKRIKYDNI